jgi:predicted amidohydrolase
MTTPFAIAGLQLATSGLRSNLPYLRARLDHAMMLFPWVDMVVFSERAAYGPALKFAQPLEGKGQQAFAEMAARHKLWIVNGSIFEKSADGKIYNTASVFNPQGEVVGRHRKMFPFRPYEKDVAAGTEFLTFDVPEVGRFAVSICYDMWFPETTRTLACLGAEVILHPTLTGTLDRDIELSIARASAAINQCYFFDINGVGAGGGGRSIVVGPDGDIIHQAGPTEEVIPLEIDLDRVRRGRERGLLGLAQPLKGFRDAPIDFPVGLRNAPGREFLDTLGPLVKPGRAGGLT